MSEFHSLAQTKSGLLILWLLVGLWTFYISLFRAFVDRIRAGTTPSPNDQRPATKLVFDLLKAPNQDRPFHVEAALLSALQILLGVLFFIELQFFESGVFGLLGGFLLSFLAERMTAGLLPRVLVSTECVSLQLSIGYPFMLFARILAFPLSAGLAEMERLLFSKSQNENRKTEDESEVADHIRILGREGSNLEPEIFEIMGNALEMSQLHVKDVMVPRNQVQILDDNDSVEENLEIARSCGHTRLPLCAGDLDHCLGIVHVKYAFKKLGEGNELDLRAITKSPVLLASEESLPSALKKMMKWKVHMALVGDEFGGIDGVITLENILEEVVGEIQDEFDAEELSVVRIADGKWKISGLTPVHDLPEELGLDDHDEELATFGGLITRELGKIPKRNETIRFSSFDAKVLNADETRVLDAEVSLLPNRKSE